MSRFDELDEQVQQEWRARVVQKRLALSASVEETLQDSSFAIEEEFDEGEEEEQMTASAKDTHNTTLIPPRLSLQSRQLPVMHTRSTSGTPKLLSTPTGEGPEPLSVDNIHTLARLTRQLAVVDGTLSTTSIPYDDQSMPKIESVTSAQPMTHTAQLPVTPRSQAIPAFPVIPPSRPPALPQVTPDTQYSLQRTTKVRLQADPEPDLVERVG